MPLRISNLQTSGQVGVLNDYLDQQENRLRALELSSQRTNAVATGTSGGGSTPSGSSSSLLNIKSVVANYTIQTGDAVLLVNSSGPVSITLTAIAAQKGQVWRIKNINTGLVTLVAANGFSVENLPFVTLPLQMQSFDVLFAGSAAFWIL